MPYRSIYLASLLLSTSRYSRGSSNPARQTAKVKAYILLGSAILYILLLIVLAQLFLFLFFLLLHLVIEPWILFIFSPPLFGQKSCIGASKKV